MPKQLIVKGHTLRYEGRINLGWQFGSGIGRARCSCGEVSDQLPTTVARQRWHREHKQAVLRGLNDGREAPKENEDG